MAIPQKYSWKLKAFHFSNRFVRRLYSFILAIHQGIWLGLLVKKSLNNLIDSNYDDWSSYHDHEYLSSGLWPWEQASVDKYFRDCHTLLVGAAGGGREIFALSKMNYQVDGFDCNLSMAKTALAEISRNSIPCKFEISEPDHVPASCGIYDGMILGWSGYSHIIGKDARVQFLTEFRRHIHKGGPVLISFFSYGNKSPMFSTIYYIGNLIRILLLRKERVEYGDTLIETYLHHLNQAGIEQELRLAGFSLEYYSDHGFGHAVALAI